MKNKNLKIMSMLMSTILTLSNIEMVNAMSIDTKINENSSISIKNQESNSNVIDMTKISENENIKEYISSVLSYGEIMNKFENDYNINLESIKDKLVFENPKYNERLFNDSEEYFNKNENQYVSKFNNYTILDEKEVKTIDAKTSAITYSMQIAEVSIKRNRLSGDAISKEAQYMFLSHYVDRQSYYWGDKDSNKLLDGPTMSGINGLLAGWITDNDRLVYDSYIKITDGIETMGMIFNTFRELDYDNLTTIGNYANKINETNSKLEKAKYVFDYYQSCYDDTTTITDDIIPLFCEELEFQLSLDNDKNAIDESVKAIADKYYYTVEDIEPEDVVGAIMDFVITIVTPGGVQGFLIDELVSFGVDSTSDLFDYVAWIGMIQSLNGRRSARLFEYYMS